MKEFKQLFNWPKKQFFLSLFCKINKQNKQLTTVAAAMTPEAF